MPRADTTATLKSALELALGRSLEPAPAARLGGSFGECLRWRADEGDLFVKLGPAERQTAFEAEAAGLEELTAAGVVRVPAPLGVGSAGHIAWLALRWIDFGALSRRTEAVLGERLASLHRVTAPRFGWHRDNTIGTTPQHNAWDGDWVRFFVHRRLVVQLDLAETNGASDRLLERGRFLCEIAEALFSSYRPLP